jgi:hypothetical protein
MSAPKSDTATIEARKNRLLELLTEGKSQVDAAEQLRVEGYPADDRTVRRDVFSLRGQWGKENMSEFQRWQAEHIEELQLLREQLLDDKIKPDRKIELTLAIIREDSKIKGTAAPSKSISATVNLNPEHSTDYLLFKEACAGLTEDQLHEVYAMARTLPRTWVAPPIEANFPPPMVRELTEVTDETI